jgi:hypothetical protein
MALADEICGRYGVAVDLAIHEPNRHGDQRNHHGHLLATTRTVDEYGNFGAKTRLLDSFKTGPAEIISLRAFYADVCNRELELAGFEERIDHRSNEERGIPDEPSSKMGVSATNEERRTGEPSARRFRIEEEKAQRAVKFIGGRYISDQLSIPSIDVSIILNKFRREADMTIQRIMKDVARDTAFITAMPGQMPRNDYVTMVPHALLSPLTLQAETWAEQFKKPVNPSPVEGVAVQEQDVRSGANQPSKTPPVTVFSIPELIDIHALSMLMLPEIDTEYAEQSWLDWAIRIVANEFGIVAEHLSRTIKDLRQLLPMQAIVQAATALKDVLQRYAETLHEKIKLAKVRRQTYPRKPGGRIDLWEGAGNQAAEDFGKLAAAARELRQKSRDQAMTGDIYLEIAELPKSPILEKSAHDGARTYDTKMPDLPVQRPVAPSSPSPRQWEDEVVKPMDLLDSRNPSGQKPGASQSGHLKSPIQMPGASVSPQDLEKPSRVFDGPAMTGTIRPEMPGHQKPLSPGNVPGGGKPVASVTSALAPGQLKVPPPRLAASEPAADDISRPIDQTKSPTPAIEGKTVKHLGLPTAAGEVRQKSQGYAITGGTNLEKSEAPKLPVPGNTALNKAKNVEVNTPNLPAQNPLASSRRAFPRRGENEVLNAIELLDGRQPSREEKGVRQTVEMKSPAPMPGDSTKSHVLEKTFSMLHRQAATGSNPPDQRAPLKPAGLDNGTISHKTVAPTKPALAPGQAKVPPPLPVASEPAVDGIKRPIDQTKSQSPAVDGAPVEQLGRADMPLPPQSASPKQESEKVSGGKSHAEPIKKKTDTGQGL